MPHVSVVIPAYNAERFLGAAIESVLAQTSRDLEMIVVDDGSQDGTASVARRYGEAIRYLRQDNSGVAVARNRGISESLGEYVAFLDADDTWRPDKLEKQLAALERQPGYRACHTAHTIVDDDLRPLGVARSPRRASILEDLILRGNVVGSICSVLCARELFDVVGGFDPALSQCADWDMWIRIGGLTDFLYLDEPLVTYRQHGTNMSRDALLYERDSMYLLDKAFRSPSLPDAIRRKRRQAYGRIFMVLAGSYWKGGSTPDFIRCAARAVALDPRQALRLLGFPARFTSRAYDRLRSGRP
jgi:glycosyltransferase involved in cell wall biosynthesis